MIKRCPVILLALALLLSGCASKGVIPPRKMASILHDMYILDAQIENRYEFIAMADTSSVYGALFDEYGYTVDDFNKSLDYYLHNPVQFKEIFKMAHDRYEKEAAAIDAEFADTQVVPTPDDPDEHAGKVPRGRRNRQLQASPDEIELE